MDAEQLKRLNEERTFHKKQLKLLERSWNRAFWQKTLGRWARWNEELYQNERDKLNYTLRILNRIATKWPHLEVQSGRVVWVSSTGKVLNRKVSHWSRAEACGFKLPYRKRGFIKIKQGDPLVDKEIVVWATQRSARWVFNQNGYKPYPRHGWRRDWRKFLLTKKRAIPLRSDALASSVQIAVLQHKQKR